MTTTPLPPAIEPVAWFEYARKKPTLKRLVFDRTSRSQLRVAGWVSEPLVKESDAIQARADLEAENQRLRGALEKLTHYAECQVAAFSNGRPFLDMTLFPRLCADARAALEKQP